MKPNNDCNCATLCSAPKHAKGTNNVSEIHWIGQLCENDPMKSSCTEGTTLFYTEKSVYTGFFGIFGAGTKFILCRSSSIGSSKCFSK